ncbi:peptidylprolyl isomerase [Botrimarina sp.]|uniref:peptidylprolyl isomerase n=1 Tax=Botrimarina sp. TaxID=2795802 RepID=UPI0032F0855D
MVSLPKRRTPHPGATRHARRPLRVLLAAAVLAAPAAPARAAEAPAASEARPLAPCQVIARVNSEVILACDVDWLVELTLQQQLGPDFEARVPADALRTMREQRQQQLVIQQIEMALLYADFRSNAPQADLTAIKKQLAPAFEEGEVERLQKLVGAEDRAELEARLLELGTSLSERRDEFYRTMIARSWLTQSTQVKTEISHEEILGYYREHEAEYYKPDRCRWEEMMVRFDRHASEAEAWASLANRLNPLLEKIDATPPGEPAFAEFAATHSDGFTADSGGDHDWTTKGALVAEEVDRALFELPVGQRSKILRSNIGLHVVRVIERKEAGPIPFSDVQAAIKKGLGNERFDAAVQQRLSDLKKSARMWTHYTGDCDYSELAQLATGGAVRR